MIEQSPIEFETRHGRAYPLDNASLSVVTTGLLLVNLPVRLRRFQECVMLEVQRFGFSNTDW